VRTSGIFKSSLIINQIKIFNINIKAEALNNYSVTIFRLKVRCD